MTRQTNKWNAHYQAQNTGMEMIDPLAAQVLSDHVHLLPARGEALDLACGLGGNALLLARHGLQTSAWDASAQAISGLESRAQHADLVVQTQVRDVEQNPPPPDSFDIIVVSQFLYRPIVPDLVASLRPGGLLMYQTFTRDKVRPGGPSNPDYLLREGELLERFAALRLRVYREECALGDVDQGFRNQALLVAQKPTS